MTAFVVMLILWIVLGLAMALLAGLLFKDEPPYGAAADYLIGVAVSVAVGVLDWLILPPLGFKPGPLTLAIEVLDPAGGALLVLWLLRYLKRRLR